ncbi:uncharacterized protein [Henckelia pumila]|uniref:uncharacterized protein n=1 Tax=Henckelia pumila TaxID=405737 RepID=UPI003C6E5CB6
MDLQGYELSPVKTALYGFAEHTVQPQGEMLLPITLGLGDEKRTVMKRFTLVEAPSSYNIILGRPTMNAFRAVASDYHQNIKFPVGEVRGDQPSSRRLERRGGQGGREVCSVEESKGEYEEVELVLGQEGKFVKIARDLETNLAEQLKSCLIRNKDVFAWAQGDLMGVSSHVAEHNLNITPGSRPVLQKKRYFEAEKDKVIVEQVQELLRAGHIKELVDSTSGCELLCFMDAYEGYHQIPLALEDQDKVSFVTSGGATYQRMMDKVFREQMGRNMEYGIKLNLAKCMFGVKNGKFLGFIVTERGIKFNPEKVKLLQEMPLPASIKEGAEVRYTEIEKMSLALVITARKLRPYFVSHPVTVLTNSLLGRFMTHPDASGRLVKWTVELVEYDIEYQPCKAIKAQALSDSLTEVATFGKEEV